MTAPDTSPEALLGLARELVDRAKGNEQVEVVLSHSTSTTIRAYEQDVESFTTATASAIGIRVIEDGRAGFASAGTHDRLVIDELLDQARTNARFAEPDEFVALAQPDGVEATEFERFSEALASVSAEEKIALALEVERRVKAADTRITGVRTAAYGDNTVSFALASSTGLGYGERATSASVSVHALAADGDRTMSGGGGDAAADPSGLDLDGVVERAVRQAVDLIGSTKPKSVPVQLVLDQRIAASLYGIIAGMLTGDRIVKGRSPFVHRLGEAIASPLLSIADTPLDRESLAATSYDGEGLACRNLPLITDGVLENFLFDDLNARKYGTTSTASAQRSTRGLPSPGVHVLSVPAGDGGDLEQLIAGVDQGVLVFGLAGFHSGVNPVSGDLSLGVDGRMIRNGQVAEPISEATVGSTLQRMMLGITAVGSDRLHLPGGAVCPSLVVGDVMLSGASG
ncbi:MAG: TldD/PmbA family protein [Acidimicrobiales bacterium]